MNQTKIPNIVRFPLMPARLKTASVPLLFFTMFSVPVTIATEPGERHCLMGCPTRHAAPDSPIDRSLYALMNDPHTKFARWVAYRVYRSNFDCNDTVPRNWSRDPDIDPDDTLTPGDYDAANVTLAVDRGHQVPLASFKCHRDVQTTNYLSNTTPQFAKLNRGPWIKTRSRGARSRQKCQRSLDHDRPSVRVADGEAPLSKQDA